MSNYLESDRHCVGDFVDIIGHVNIDINNRRGLVDEGINCNCGLAMKFEMVDERMIMA